MNEAILHLLTLYFNGESLSEEQTASLQQWMASSPHKQEALKLLEDKHFLQGAIRQRENYITDLDKNWQVLLQHINTEKEPKPVRLIHRIHFLKTARFRYAAAILLIIIGSAVYFVIDNKKTASGIVTKSIVRQNDIAAPSVSRAMITLANGQQIYLDSVMNGHLAIEGKVNIQKMDDGRIVYNGTDKVGQLRYNTLTVPRGSQIAQLVLSDGSRVFLNAASSLRYPVAFMGNERRVEITGEAYFEVAKDPLRKFIVSSGDVTTEVLGTHFNINAYADEEANRITLLEGSIKALKNGDSMMLIPGEQVQTTVQGKLQLNRNVDLAQVTAWQKGMFVFNDMTLPAILRQVSRWYNITVKYEGNIPATSYGGGLSRNLPLLETIKLLELGNVKFKLEGNTLIAQPK